MSRQPVAIVILLGLFSSPQGQADEHADWATEQ
jgi:hypothetical protein